MSKATSFNEANKNSRNIIFRKEAGGVVVLLFYVHGKHLRSCWDGQLT